MADQFIQNQSFPDFRDDLNTNLFALFSNSSSSNGPFAPNAYQFWADDQNYILNIRDMANAKWVPMANARADRVRAISANATLDIKAFDSDLIVSTASSNVTITLPAGTSVPNGWKVRIKFYTGSNRLNIQTSGSDSITLNNGIAVNNLYLSQGQQIELRSDGASLFHAGNDASLVAAVHNQGKLTKPGGNLLWVPFNGNRIMINGILQTIPSGGYAISPSGLAANTIYYLYAYLSSGVLQVETTTTAHATGPHGNEVKAGDATRTLIGQARTTASTQWADTPQQRFVRSWANDAGVTLYGTFSAERTYSNASTVGQISPEIACEFLMWAGESVRYNVSGSLRNPAAGNGAITGIGVDSQTSMSSGFTRSYSYTNDVDVVATAATSRSDLAEGYHYATVLAQVLGSGTTKWRPETTLNIHVSR